MSARNGRNILITSAPKSGTTWTYHLLQNITGANPARLHADPVFGAEIDVARIVNSTRQNAPWVAMMHMCPNAWTGYAVAHFDVAAVVLVRNVFDSIVSYDDDIIRGFQGRKPPITSMLNIPEQYLDWKLSKRLDFLIALYVPWLAFFLTGWSSVTFEKHWVTYEEMRSDTQGTLRRILNAANFNDIGSERIEEVMAEYRANSARSVEKTRFNKGQIGRGEAKLSARQKQEILRIFSFYPDLDIEGLGVIEPQQLERLRA